MARIQDIDLPYLEFGEAAAPSTPAAGVVRIYAKTDGKLYQKDDAGTESDLASGAATFVGVRAYAGATTSCNDSTWTSIALNSERFDTNTFHDTSTNNSRLTVPSGQGGTYLIGGNGGFAANATGLRGFRILLNGTTRIADHFMIAVSGGVHGTRAVISTLYALAQTDYVEFQQWQNSGGALNTENVANSTVEFWMQKVG